MAAPGQSPASPGMAGMDGLSGMLSLIRERAARRRQGFGSPAQDTLDPISVQAATDAIQAPAIEDDGAGMTAGLTTQARPIGGGGGDSPFRTAQMTEEDEPEIQETGNCPGGVCYPEGQYMEMGQPYFDQGQAMMPMEMRGMPAQGSIVQQQPIGATLSMPADIAPDVMDAYAPLASRKEITPGELAMAHMTASQMMFRAAQMGGPNQRAYLERGADFQRQAMETFETAQLRSISDQKYAAERTVVEAERARLEQQMELDYLRTPQGRMETVMQIVGNEDNDLNSRTLVRPELRAWAVHSDNKLKRGEAQTGDAALDAMEFQYLKGMAFAADISRLMVQRVESGRMPLGDDYERQYGLSPPMQMAMMWYGTMDPASQEQALHLELQPALQMRMVKSETEAYRRATGNEAATLPVGRLAAIEEQALDMVNALKMDLQGKTIAVPAQGDSQEQAALPQQAPSQAPPMSPSVSPWLNVFFPEGE